MNSVRVQRTADRENITVIRKEFNLPKNKKKINFYNWPLSLKKKATKCYVNNCIQTSYCQRICN
jgi:hypothetical protein